MPSRCKLNLQLLASGKLSLFTQGAVNIQRVLALSSSLIALSFAVCSLPSQATGGADVRAGFQSRNLIAENAGYDGATLPAPVKKKNQVTVSTEDEPEISAPRHRKPKHGADIDADPMSNADTAGGATLPPPKKGLRAADMSGAKASGDKDQHPSPPGGGPGGPEKKGPRGDRDGGLGFGKGPLDLTALNLTDDQKQKIAQMHADNGTKMRDLMRKRHELSNQMKDVMFQADVTEVQIRAKRDEVRQVQEKLEDLRLNDFLAIRSLLTPEQKQKLKDVKIANNHGRDGELPPGGPPPRRGEGTDSKRLADTPAK